MDSLFEILFVALILLAPLLESLLKKGKKPKGTGDQEAGRRTPPERRTGSAPAEHRSRQRPRPEPGGTRSTSTSEGLIPPEIWEELTGVRTRPGAEEDAAPAEVPGQDGEAETSWWEEGKRREGEAVAGDAVGTREIGEGGIREGEIRPGQARGAAAHGREPTELTAEQAELAARFERAQARMEAPGSAVGPASVLPGMEVVGRGRANRLLAGASRRRLQDAVLLHEILGPPVSLRRDGSGGAS